MIDQDTLSKASLAWRLVITGVLTPLHVQMCHLLADSSVEVQKMIYPFLHEAAKKRTEYLVIEAGVDTDDAVEAQLPTELISILQQSSTLEGDDQEHVRTNKFTHTLFYRTLISLE